MLYSCIYMYFWLLGSSSVYMHIQCVHVCVCLFVCMPVCRASMFLFQQLSDSVSCTSPAQLKLCVSNKQKTWIVIVLTFFPLCLFLLWSMPSYSLRFPNTKLQDHFTSCLPAAFSYSGNYQVNFIIAVLCLKYTGKLIDSWI